MSIVEFAEEILGYKLSSFQKEFLTKLDEMSNDISTMYAKNENQKAGRKGYYMWKREKETPMSPSDYGNYILQHGKRGKKK